MAYIRIVKAKDESAIEGEKRQGKENAWDVKKRRGEDCAKKEEERRRGTKVEAQGRH